MPPWQQRTDYLKSLLDEGLGSNLMLSHDWNIVLTRLAPPGFPSREENPDGYLWLTRAVIPRLKEAGIPQSAIDQLMKDGKIDRPDEPKGPIAVKPVSGVAVPKAGRKLGGGPAPQGA